MGIKRIEAFILEQSKNKIFILEKKFTTDIYAILNINGSCFILYKIKTVEPLKICFQLFWKVSVDSFENFLLKIAVQSMTTEISNLTIISVKKELGL